MMAVRAPGGRILAGLIAAFATNTYVLEPETLGDRYERAQRVWRSQLEKVSVGAVHGAWTNASTFEYTQRCRQVRVVVGAAQPRFSVSDTACVNSPSGEREPQGVPDSPSRSEQTGARGNLEQIVTAVAPNGQWRVVGSEGGLWLHQADAPGRRRRINNGDGDRLAVHGIATRGYGTQFAQQTGIWWSPDSRRVAFYRFTRRDRKSHTASPTEWLEDPSASRVDIQVHDISRGSTVTVGAVGHGNGDSAPGYYVYAVSWTPDARELLFIRVNRTQNILELAAADPGTGVSRTIVRETRPNGWIVLRPQMRFLADGRRFIWSSERNGRTNLYLRSLDGHVPVALTQHASANVGALIRLDESTNTVFYMANDGDNPMKWQLHRVGLDGTGGRRLTAPEFNHTIQPCERASLVSSPQRGVPTTPGCGLSPDGRWFVDVYETHERPPAGRIVNALTGEVAANLSVSPKLTTPAAEIFEFVAADDLTVLRGVIERPIGFDDQKRYPVLLAIHGAPESTERVPEERFRVPSPLTSFGMLVVSLETRAVPRFGRDVLDSVYRNLGQAEVDDVARGVSALTRKSYVDADRIAIVGTSYGGYCAVMALLRYPRMFAAAVASSAPTDWRRYNRAYAERYMGLLSQNARAYERSAVEGYTSAMAGHLMLYYGTEDRNVRPQHSIALLAALRRQGKNVRVSVGDGRGHSEVPPVEMLSFILDLLIPRKLVSNQVSQEP